MKHVQRGGSIAESKQEAHSFEAGSVAEIAEMINNTIERIAVRAASVSVVRFGDSFRAVVLFEEDQ